MEASEPRFVPPPGRPVAERRRVVHEVHGVTRVDDYAWLLDAADPRTAEYLDAEQAYYAAATSPLLPLRRRIAAEIAGRLPSVDASVAWRRHGLIYFTRSRRDDEYDRLYLLDPVTHAETLVLDLNAVARATPFVAPGTADPSPDGSLVAYTVDRDGAGAFGLRFRAVATGADAEAVAGPVAAGGAWSADGRAYYYAALDARGRAHEIRRHDLGTRLDRPGPVVLAEPDPRFSLGVSASRDGGWIVLRSAAPGTSEVHLLPSSGADPGPPRLVARRREGVEYTVEPLPGGWDGAGVSLLLIVTNADAPEFRLVTAPVPAPGSAGAPGTWTPVAGLPGGDGERLEAAVVLDGHVVLTARRDGEPFLRVITRPAAGEALPAPLVTRELHPGVRHGQVRLWHPDDPSSAVLVVVEENLITPPAWVAIDLASGARAVIKRMAVPDADPSAYVTERLDAPAPDGVRVPVTIAHRRDARRGRTTGLLLTGYGARECSSWPRFDPGTYSLLDRGMAVAVAHVRGGGELGRSWWAQAVGAEATQRTFVDYVAVRDALVAAGWAGEVRGGAKVVSRGVGAGGLLQAAVFSRAPRMWRAVVAEFPFADVVTLLGGDGPWALAGRGEWGDPAGSADDFAAMLAWSPYDNPPPPGRPALLVTAAVPGWPVPAGEPAKWVARLRATDDPHMPAPLVLRVDPAGRSARPAGRAARREYEAEILAWVLGQLRLR